ncbi:MAG: hypothetical protein ACKOTD_04080, partial [Phycisphaerales bacterium]
PPAARPPRTSPPPPTEDTGPKPIGMLGSTVYLEGGRTATVGKETDGVTVLEVVNPWKLRVLHKGKEYDVTVGQPPNQSIFRPLGSATLPSGLSVRRAEDAPAEAPAGAGGPTPPAATEPAPVPEAATRPANTDESAPIPMPVNRAQVSRMDAAAARAALAAVTAAKARADLDAALRQRLDSEESWLVDRLSQLES